MALLCFCLVRAAAAPVSFTASLDRDTITLGENATLVLTLQGSSDDQPGPPPIPAIPGLNVGYAGPMTQISMVNGDTTYSITHNYRVTPTQVGQFTIPALTVVAGGARLTTQPLRLTVLKPSGPPPEAIASGSEPAFLRLVVPKQQFYLGEPMQAEIQVYARQGVGLSGIDRTSFPAEGFNVSQQMIPGAKRNVRIGSAVYQLLPVLFTVTPVKTGAMTLGPATFNAVLELPSQGRQRDPFFEHWGFPGFLSRGEQKQVVLATGATNLQCLPWPSQNVPPGFKGAVGDYSMTMTAGPTNLVAGDPITLRVRIAGHGALDSLVFPEQPAWPDFKTFAPVAKPAETAGPFGLQGARTFEQIVVPQSPEVKELPPFSFSFFDPSAGAYRTLTQPATPLLVRPGGSVAAPSFVAADRKTQDAPPPAQDIVDIKLRLGAVAQIGPPLLARPWFILLESVPVLVWAWALAWRKNTDRLANNPRLRRRRQLDRTVRNGLNQMRRLAAENQSDPFFATLFRLLQEQLGERLDLPASAITEAVVEERLRPRGVPEPLLAHVQEWFQRCNLVRYAPVKSAQELAALIPKFEATLHELQAIAA